MSLLVMGLSHHNAPLALLERISLDSAARRRLATSLAGHEHIAETVVVSTCNRTEVYAEAVTFHGAVAAVTDAFEEIAGISRTELTERLAVHFEDRAIAHAFRVAGGLDSMALGESQIRAQLRTSLHEAQEERVVGPSLNTLFQRALRVGKRVHTDTAISAVSGSLVDAGLRAAEPVLGPLGQRTVLIVGAGAMASLAATTAQRAGAGELLIVNRTLARGAALAARVGGEALRFAELPSALVRADVVISCIGSPGVVIDEAAVAAAQSARVPSVDAADNVPRDPDGTRAQVYLDLAMPHDIAHEVGRLPGVTRLGLEHLGAVIADSDTGPQVQAATDIVTGEVAAYLTERSAQAAAPTIAALRARASDVLEAELARLLARTPHLADGERREVEIAMGRLVDKLLHAPTVRVKELAASGQFGAYADALAELFALDPQTVATVSAPPPFGDGPSAGSGEGVGSR